MARLDETARTRGAEAFDLKDLIEDLAGTYQAEAARHGGSLTLELRPAPVRGDRAQLRRMFSNLLDNALRHGPEGGTVRVSLSVEDGAARVRVHDEGGRIPPESLPRLFDRFYRTDQSRTRTTGGVGLGLSIAREIAVRHGGDIAATSSPASGTCFTVTMPTA
jgi:signal transduction histidine kinase